MGLGPPRCLNLVQLSHPVNCQDSEDLNQGIREDPWLLRRPNKKMYQLCVNGLCYRPGPQEAGLWELDSVVMSITEGWSNSDCLIWQLQQSSHPCTLYSDLGGSHALSPSLLGWWIEFCQVSLFEQCLGKKPTFASGVQKELQ